MLERLSIQNYAIIDELEIRFNKELNIITGETGAGKSILMGALSLILGDRADLSVLLNREKKCVVEGFFSVGSKPEILLALKAADLDPEEELVIRREIGTNGKSRAFVNDTPVNLEQLRGLSSLLVDLHRQFDTLELGESLFQRQVLDALAGHQKLLDQYQGKFTQWQEARHSLETLTARKAQFIREYDYNKFLFEELDEAGFRDQELEAADAELKLLSHSEGIKAALQKVVHALGEGDRPLVNQLKVMATQLQPFTGYHSALPALVARLQSVQIELKDILGETEHITEQVQFDPERMNALSERIALGYRLQKKHGVNTTAELLHIRQQLQQKLEEVLDIDQAILRQEAAVEKCLKEASDLALKLSQNRQREVKPLQDKVNKLLNQVGMPNARLKVDISEVPLNEYGTDRVEFLFDANKSNRFEPVRKVASGGELSRLMLCIKSLVARSLDLPTLIFDEIDTGISGEAARQVGVILKELSLQRQVICITHQPQIAGKAKAHFFVYKEIKGDVIKTSVRELSQEERITAIARMLSGEKPTAAALENAREMVGN